jgi:ADP-ribose pyrophosphatase YjhB (NUDIX family)
MVKIYIQNKTLFLVDKINQEVDDYLHRRETIFIDELNMPAVRTMLQQMEQPEVYTGVFLHPKLSELLTAFKEQLQVIIAAGGLVYTPEKELLLIHRLGKWDLPKGKLDSEETLEACALREINEETGAEQLSVEKPLLTTYHTYHQHGKNILKESHWYLVKAAKKTALKPQTEEDITQCIWVPMAEVEDYVDGAFAAIADVLKAGIALLDSEAK